MMRFSTTAVLFLLSCVFFPAPTMAQDGPVIGDAPHGALLFSTRCAMCHGFDGNKYGPSMHGVFGRKAGTVPGYNYTDALKSSAIIWDQENLEKWLAKPEALVPGTKMNTVVTQVQDRADIVAYLKSLALPNAVKQ